MCGCGCVMGACIVKSCVMQCVSIVVLRFEIGRNREWQ